MPSSKPITIVGGGLAGLTLGIALRQRGMPVTLSEAGHYPRHRVCGEFISGHGQETLARLGLRDLLEQAGAVGADTAAFFSTTKSTGPRPLPARAVCLSRFTLDNLLAEKFRELGGELLEGHRRDGEAVGEGVVRATGRHAQTEENGARWFGLKAHARDVTLAADLEMHVSPGGYIGLCRVNGGVVNVCGLFRQRAGEGNRRPDRFELLRGPIGSLLHQRLATAEFDEASFCAVAGLSLQPLRAASRNE
jgi:2-polyprenyl-6-methoxyphenol hydroxylase-like FAD-dependent oxidoreductase